MISVARIGNTSWVCNPRWVSYAFEEVMTYAIAKKVVHNKAWNPLYTQYKYAIVT